jgi:hypothetical protein
MDDVDQMEWNEYQRLERAIDARRKRIEGLEKGSPVITQRNFRYVLDYNFDFVIPQGADPEILPFVAETPPAQTRSFIVKSEATDGKRTHFFVKSIEASYAILASRDVSPPVGQRFFIGPDYRRNFFDFTWRVRDTGSDREWQNTSLPSQLLLTGNVNPLLYGNGHCMLSGGTEVLVDIAPTFSGNLLARRVSTAVFSSPIVDIKAHFLQLCFVGVEVLL